MEENERLNDQVKSLQKQLAEPPNAGTTSKSNIDDILRKVRRESTQTEVYESACVKNTKDAEVKSQINKLQLASKQKKKADDMAKALISHMHSNMSATARTAFQEKIEKYVVEWGVPVKVVGKKVDHSGACRLLAAAAVSAESAE